jgi:hypothetical protein
MTFSRADLPARPTVMVLEPRLAGLTDRTGG